MEWVSFRGLIFVAAAAMFAYSLRRLVVGSGARLVRISQVLFFAALMLIALPTDPTTPGDRNWPFWIAFALLLASFGATILHKLRRPPTLPDQREPGGR